MTKKAILMFIYLLFGYLNCNNPANSNNEVNYFGKWKGISCLDIDYDSLGNVLTQRTLDSDPNGYEWVLEITDSISTDYDHRTNDSVYYSMSDTLFFRNNHFNPQDSIRYHNPETYLAYSFYFQGDSLIFKMWSDMIDTSWNAKGSMTTVTITYYKRYFGSIPLPNWPKNVLY